MPSEVSASVRAWRPKHHTARRRSPSGTLILNRERSGRGRGGSPRASWLRSGFNKSRLAGPYIDEGVRMNTRPAIAPSRRRAGQVLGLRSTPGLGSCCRTAPTEIRSPCRPRHPEQPTTTATGSRQPRRASARILSPAPGACASSPVRGDVDLAPHTAATDDVAACTPIKRPGRASSGLISRLLADNLGHDGGAASR